jgi:prolyl 4-hydroxylase
MRETSPVLAQVRALWTQGRHAEAVNFLEAMAANNDATALSLLAEMKWRGGIVPQDLAQARDFYRRAGEAGHAPSACAYTNLLANGVAGRRDWIEAVKRLRQEAAHLPNRLLMLHLLEKMDLTAEGDPVSVPDPTELSSSPKVVTIRGLFSAAECDYLNQLAAPGYTPATVNDPNGRPLRDPIRDSEGSTIHWLIEDPVVHALNRRLAAASGTAYEQGEALQILRYARGQQYRAHVDAVPSTENQRATTALVYLNQDFEGGETFFLKVGLKVKGNTGDALIFRNATADGKADFNAEHAGLPVTSGTKLLASRWIRERRWIP